MELAILIYILIMNIIGFLIMGIDKAKAKKNAWRIPEKAFFIVSLLGGGLGSWFGMYTFRHKTRHWYFVIGIPAIAIIELGIMCYFLFMM